MRYMNKRLATDMADANGLQRAKTPTGFFNIKKMAADFCSAQCIMDNTGSLMFIIIIVIIIIFIISLLIFISFFIYTGTSGLAHI